MISVEAAQALCLEQAPYLGSEKVPLSQAAGRVLHGALTAARPQPPCDVSAMDGYAITESDARPGATLTIVGESAAGHRWSGTLVPGQAVRIFTGAAVPSGASRVVIQENTTRDGDNVTLTELGDGANIRAEGSDFGYDFKIEGPRILSPSDLALLASMNIPDVYVGDRPRVAILSTGDELVMPGARPEPDQIVASNIFALEAMIRDAGGLPTILPIAGDSRAALHAAFDSADDADLLVTVGGASVGDHDLVSTIAQERGIPLAFHKIAMRPGKPLMAGTSRNAAFVGLPGNPISAIVCGHLFVLPMIRRMQGLVDVLPVEMNARLDAPLSSNGPRAHYMRARFHEGPDGRRVQPFDRQDSSLLSVMADANCLLRRPPHDDARQVNDVVTVLPI